MLAHVSPTWACHAQSSSKNKRPSELIIHPLQTWSSQHRPVGSDIPLRYLIRSHVSSLGSEEDQVKIPQYRKQHATSYLLSVPVWLRSQSNKFRPRKNLSSQYNFQTVPLRTKSVGKTCAYQETLFLHISNSARAPSNSSLYTSLHSNSQIHISLQYSRSSPNIPEENMDMFSQKNKIFPRCKTIKFQSERFAVQKTSIISPCQAINSRITSRTIPTANSAIDIQFHQLFCKSINKRWSCITVQQNVIRIDKVEATHNVAGKFIVWTATEKPNRRDSISIQFQSHFQKTNASKMFHPRVSSSHSCTQNCRIRPKHRHRVPHPCTGVPKWPNLLNAGGWVILASIVGIFFLNMHSNMQRWSGAWARGTFTCQFICFEAIIRNQHAMKPKL